MKYLLIIFVFTNVAFAEIKISGDRILITDEPIFEKKLELKKFVVSGRDAVLSETGFIVSSTQSSFENDAFVGRWVSLDEHVLIENQVKINEVKPSKGSAYGLMSTSRDFAPDLKIGQELTIKRYGLSGDHFQGKIIKLIDFPGKDTIQIHFIANAPELIAGTTCEVLVPRIRKLPFKVSLLSLLHLGLEDYIVLKDEEGAYVPKHVTILDQDSEIATILVPLKKETEYVARGAILLKPLLNKIISVSGEKR